MSIIGSVLAAMSQRYAATPFSGRSSALWFTTSGSYTIQVSGWYRIQAIAGAGSGAVIAVLTSSALCGGNGGAYCESEYYLTAGTVVTFNIGLGGASVTTSGSAVVNGNNGGATTVSSPAFPTMTANGGLGGLGSTSVTPSAGAAATATGGNVANFSGGVAGVPTFTAGAFVATGGAASGSPFGAGASSGAASASSTFVAVTGGAGILPSGSASATSANTASSGGGSGTASANATNGNNTTNGRNRYGVSTVYNFSAAASEYNLPTSDPLRTLNGSGTPAQQLYNAGFGAGTGAVVVSGTVTGGAALLIGGSGAVYASPGNGTSGPAGLGGGSGAVIGNTNATSAAGGNGYVIIERIG